MVSFQICSPQKVCVTARAEGGVGELVLSLAVGYALVQILPALFAPDTRQVSVRQPLREIKP
jgi:hypothetical protein